MSNNQSGNALIIILVTIALFAALIMVFSRSTEQGTGNMSVQQTRMAAQELIAFFNQVDSAVQRLRSKGCSENDISFANSGDAGTFVAANHSSTAPGDFSCHVFRQEGGQVTFNMDWTKYQVPYSSIPAAQQLYHGQIRFKSAIYIKGVGNDSTADLSIVFDYVTPEICAAYNMLLNQNIDLSIYEADGSSASPIGSTNTALARKNTACYGRGSTQTKLYYAWSAR